MRILITNDDGYEAEGIRLLASWVRRRFPDAYIVLSSPLHQQSGKSHAINIHSSFLVKNVEMENVDLALAVDSTPADCVRFAYCFYKPFDLVFSGVNNGFNLGYDIGYSGTCAAIFEADFLKCKAVAFSTDFPHFRGAEGFIDKVWDFFEEKRLLEMGNIWNVNFPLEPSGEIRFASQGGGYFLDGFVPKGDGYFLAVGSPSDDMMSEDADSLLDTVTVCRDNAISISPFTSRNIDTELLEKLLKE